MWYDILDGDLLNSALLSRRRPPLGCDLISRLAQGKHLRDLTHAGNQTPTAEFASHIG